MCADVCVRDACQGGATTRFEQPFDHIAMLYSGCILDMPRRDGEFEPLCARNAFWISYTSMVCGCINAVALQGIFREPVTHLTGITTRMAMSVAGTPTLGYSSGDFFAQVLCFGLGAFVAGLTLAEASASGKWGAIRLDYPNVEEWRWQHQMLVSAAILCLGVAHALVKDDGSAIFEYLKGRAAKSASFVAAILLTTFASAVLNCLLTLGRSQFFVLRASHVTGNLTDVFGGLGFCVRSRDYRYLWKVRQLAFSFVFFVTGAVIGASAYEHTFGYSALLVPVIMLGPLWLLGAVLLIVQYTRRIVHNKNASAVPQLSKMQIFSSAAEDPPIGSVLSGSTDAHADDSASQLAGLKVSTVESFRSTASFDSESAGTAEAAGHDARSRFTESEGLGTSIHERFPDDLLGDLVRPMDPCDAANIAPHAVRLPGEYETIDYAHFAWVFYLSFVGGAINAIALQGIFQQTVTHMTGITTSMGIKLQFPPQSDARAGQSYTAGELALIILAFGAASFVCGFILTLRQDVSSSPRNRISLTMDYPSAITWRLQHQAILSMCLASLFASYGIAHAYTGDNKNYVNSIGLQVSSNWAFFVACLFDTFASGTLNALLSQGHRITLRATHVTGSVSDIGMGLGFALRSRSLRYMWRLRLLLLCFVSFFSGGVVGSLVFDSAFGDSAVVFPAMLLVPAWVAGVVLLVVQKRQQSGADVRA